MDPPLGPSNGQSSSYAGSPSSTGKSIPPFQSASAVLIASGASLRNASGGQTPLPKPVEAPGTGTSSNGSTSSSGPSAQSARAKPINRPASSKNAIVYNAVQRRNPVLQSIKNVGIEIGDIVADYQVGTHNGVLFLSLKYHRLHPEYIHQRIEKMKNMYNVRILLILCDVNEHQQSIRDLSKIAIVNNLTTIVAWSNDEVAQYLTTFKAYEHKSDDSLKEKVHQEYHDQLQHVLTSGKKVNKTDADNLASQFGSFADIVKQPSKLLSNVKGLGATKVTSLLDAFNKPFLVGGLKRKAEDSAPEIITSSNVRHSNDERIEDIHSPDWPMDDMDAEDALRDTEIERQRGRAPSRSPDIGPGDESGDDEVRGPPADVWKDPLDDEDDEDDDDELGSGSSSKRARVEK